MIIYLAGPIKGCSYQEATDWRNYFVKKINSDLDFIREDIKLLNPLRGKDWLEKETKIYGVYPDRLFGSPKEIVNRDLYDVYRSDIIVCNFLGAENVSIGTVSEIAYGKGENSKKRIVISIMEDDNIHNHPFVTELSDWVVNDYDTAIQIIGYVIGG